MDHFGRVSTVVYSRVDAVIGHRKSVAIRRDVYSMNDILYNITRLKGKIMTSGSRREGFCMEGSDYDVMIWGPNEHVICNMSQAQNYNPNTDVIILMEHQESCPGFVLLRWLGHIGTKYIKNSLVVWNNQLYIGSELYKKSTSDIITLSLNSQPHGPCSSAILGTTEYDTAQCFECKHWPQVATSWTTRCQKSSWPTSTVLKRIIKSGCHCVAVGAKQSPQQHIEWRISFSLAEKELVYSMSHGQFLGYGLLKLFLKEVLNCKVKDEEKLLCSYFMKTVVFWTIQTCSSFVWRPDNFLSCFWMCYKLLLKWVYHGYCPNFFIPENNMFAHKIVGSDQRRLFAQMYELYCEGIRCLLRCKSIYNHLNNVLLKCNQTVPVPTNLCLPVVKVDEEILGRLRHNCYYRIDECDYSHLIFVLCRLYQSKLSNIQCLLLYDEILVVLNRYAFGNLSFSLTTNRKRFKSVQFGLNILKYTSHKGLISDMLYLPICLYVQGRYAQALSLLEITKSKLTKPYVMNSVVCKRLYSQFAWGKPLLTRYRNLWVNDVMLSSALELEEFKLDFKVLNKYDRIGLAISPYVLVHFLSMMCYHNLRNTERQFQCLTRLHTLVHFQDRLYISPCTKNIAWHVLGIAQQICGYYDDALFSFRTSLAQKQFSLLTKATQRRINLLESERSRVKLQF